MYDPQIDGGITVDKWGYTQTTSICEENSPIAKMYTGLIDRHLTNLTEAKTTEDGYALIQEPYSLLIIKMQKMKMVLLHRLRLLWNCRIRQILKRDIISEKKRTWKHAIRRLRLCSKAMHRM